MVEYTIIALPTEWDKAEEILNAYAKDGWKVICSVNGNQIILERCK